MSDLNNKEILVKLKKVSDRKDEIKAEEKTLNAEKEYLTGLLIPMMRAEGIDKFSTKGVGTASIKPKVVYPVKDWDKVHKFIVENDEPSLLQKRISESKMAELLEGGIEVPGVERIEIDKLNFRRSNS